MSVPDPLLHIADGSPRQESELTVEKSIGNVSIDLVEHGRLVVVSSAVLVCSVDVGVLIDTVV